MTVATSRTTRAPENDTEVLFRKARQLKRLRVLGVTLLQLRTTTLASVRSGGPGSADLTRRL
jgi:hypothetical protein